MFTYQFDQIINGYLIATGGRMFFVLLGALFLSDLFIKRFNEKKLVSSAACLLLACVSFSSFVLYVQEIRQPIYEVVSVESVLVSNPQCKYGDCFVENGETRIRIPQEMLLEAVFDRSDLSDPVSVWIGFCQPMKLPRPRQPTNNKEEVLAWVGKNEPQTKVGQPCKTLGENEE